MQRRPGGPACGWRGMRAAWLGGALVGRRMLQAAGCGAGAVRCGAQTKASGPRAGQDEAVRRALHGGGTAGAGRAGRWAHGPRSCAGATGGSALPPASGSPTRRAHASICTSQRPSKHLSACVGAILAPGPADPAAAPTHRISPRPPARRASPRPALRRQQPAPGAPGGGAERGRGRGQRAPVARLPACLPGACLLRKRKRAGAGGCGCPAPALPRPHISRRSTPPRSIDARQPCSAAPENCASRPGQIWRSPKEFQSRARVACAPIPGGPNGKRRWRLRVLLWLCLFARCYRLCDR